MFVGPCVLRLPHSGTLHEVTKFYSICQMWLFRAIFQGKWIRKKWLIRGWKIICGASAWFFNVSLAALHFAACLCQFLLKFVDQLLSSFENCLQLNQLFRINFFIRVQTDSLANEWTEEFSSQPVTSDRSHKEAQEDFWEKLQRHWDEVAT